MSCKICGLDHHIRVNTSGHQDLSLCIIALKGELDALKTAAQAGASTELLGRISSLESSVSSIQSTLSQKVFFDALEQRVKALEGEEEYHDLPDAPPAGDAPAETPMAEAPPPLAAVEPTPAGDAATPVTQAAEPTGPAAV